MPDLEMRPAEWLLMSDGRIRRVVTVGTELLLYDAWIRARIRKCACGAPAIRETCGSAECVARLWAAGRSEGNRGYAGPVLTRWRHPPAPRSGGPLREGDDDLRGGDVAAFGQSVREEGAVGRRGSRRISRGSADRPRLSPARPSKETGTRSDHPLPHRPCKEGARRVSSTAVPIIVITGGSGRIGSMLRKRLARPGRTLRLLDITPPASPGPGRRGGRRLGHRHGRDDRGLRRGGRRHPPGRGVRRRAPGTRSSRSTSRVPTPCSRRPAGRACPG